MGKPKILIVEDDKSLSNLYDFALPGDLFEKKFMDNGTEAVAAYLSWKPDVIILDILLPGKCGYTILEEIRGKWNDRTTSIVVSSCLDEKSSISDCQDLGIEDYIVKPFDHKTLAGKIMNLYKAGKKGS